MTAGAFRAKMERANELLVTICEEGERIINDELKYEAISKGKAPNEWDHLQWTDEPLPHPEIGVLVGEFIHDLRSALDQLIYTLIIERKGDPGKLTSYPIDDDPTHWAREIVERDMSACKTCGARPKPSPVKGLSEAQIAFISERQPHRLPKKQRPGHPLMQLLRMSNADKHRELHICGAQIHPPTLVEYIPRGYFAVRRTKFHKRRVIAKRGAEFGRVQRTNIRRPPKGTKVQVRLRGPAMVAFRLESSDDFVTSDDLYEIGLYVRDIIGALAPDSVDRIIGPD